jgi:hypothetical protein
MAYWIALFRLICMLAGAFWVSASLIATFFITATTDSAGDWRSHIGAAGLSFQ